MSAMYFSPSFSQDKYELFEVDETFLKQLQESPEGFVIKTFQRDTEHTACISSADKTWELKKSDGSNSLYTCLKTERGLEVQKITKYYLELEPVQTQFMQVVSVMQDHRLDFDSKGPIFTRIKDQVEFDLGLREEELLELC